MPRWWLHALNAAAGLQQHHGEAVAGEKASFPHEKRVQHSEATCRHWDERIGCAVAYRGLLKNVQPLEPAKRTQMLFLQQSPSSAFIGGGEPVEDRLIPVGEETSASVSRVNPANHRRVI